MNNQFKTMADVAADMKKAMESGENVEQAFEDLCRVASTDAYEQLKQDVEAYNQTQDESILERRGVRTLTSKEEAWYNKIADVLRSGNPKQAFIEIIGSDAEDDIMPHTIIEDVFRNLTETHPLLSRIGIQSVGYLTKWILNNHDAQQAAWGAITDEISKEIQSNLRVVDIKQNKLSCYAILEMGMADLGPQFLDSYIRTVMTEAMSCALEIAVVSGDGDGMPTGMDRDLTSTTVKKAQKSAIAVTDFTPESYGTLLAEFATDEHGHSRTFSQVALICNQKDYLTKVMPATTVLNGAGAYVNNLFPFPTEVIISSAVEEGKAIMGILDEYTLFIGQAARNNVIQYSDEYRWLEDQRVFKVVQYADGTAYDNTSFQLLDISGLEPAYITVKNPSSESTSDTPSPTSTLSATAETKSKKS